VVLAPVEDPLLPAVVAVTAVDEGECWSWWAGPVVEEESDCILTDPSLVSKGRNVQNRP
jgi:hypothetical protein